MPGKHSRRRILIGAGVAALAGCTDLLRDDDASTSTPSSPPSPSQSASPSPKPEGEIAIQGVGIPVDVDLVWERVRELMDVDVEPPERVSTTYDDRSGSGWFHVRPFLARLIGVEQDYSPGRDDEERSYGGARSGGDTVRVLLGGVSIEGVELALARGFVRAIQMRKEWTRERLLQERLIAGEVPELAVVEGFVLGAARYVETAYADRYLDGHPRPPEELLDTPPEIRYFSLDRYYGYHYVDGRIDSPAELGELYDDPPRTSEQLIHQLPTDHGPAPLRVHAEDDVGWHAGGERTHGELFIRAALQAHLDREHANEASAGWGNDSHIAFRNVDRELGDVFVTRWDEPADANTFEDAMETFLDERAEPTEGGWHDQDEDLRFDLERASEDVVALVAGPDPFTEIVTVGADGADVAVTVE